MTSEKEIYIVGHKNPDTDSICSAIAFADIKNRTSKEQNYVARRAGEINEETEYVLKTFGVEAPEYIDYVGTQVKDMEIRKTPGVSKFLSIKDAWALMKQNEAVTLTITNDDEILEGILTIDDITESYMDENDNKILSKANTPFKLIAETINGEIVSGDENAIFDTGKIFIGAAMPERLPEILEEGDLVIIGDRPDTLEKAVELKAGCVIICVDGHAKKEMVSKANKQGSVIIQTSLDTYTVSRLINQSVPIEYIMRTQRLISFSTEDYTEDIEEIMKTTRHRAFPVVNKHKKYIGTVSRRNMMGMTKKQLILVDHNEKSQAVDGIDDAEILEIVDHHRLGTLETLHPIGFRNQPVGSTATILYQIYTERGLEITPNIAGLLCSAIISDTLLFKSPTCTLHDKMAAGALALIADIEIEKHAIAMFKAGSDLVNKTSEEIFHQDYKRFNIGETTFGIGQISSMDKEELELVKARISEYMPSEHGKKGVSMIFFLLTDIMNSSSELVCYGDNAETLIRDAFDVEKVDGKFILDGVVSRKKQVVPPIVSMLQNDN